MQQQHHAFSRIDARIPLAVRDTIDRAAAIQGRTRTDFLISAALERAECIIDESFHIRLTMRDQTALATALAGEHCQEPNHRMQAAIREYKERVVSK